MVGGWKEGGGRVGGGKRELVGRTDVFLGERLVSEGEGFTIVTVLGEDNEGTEFLGEGEEETGVVVEHVDVSFISSIEEDGVS